MSKPPLVSTPAPSTPRAAPPRGIAWRVMLLRVLGGLLLLYGLGWLVLLYYYLDFVRKYLPNLPDTIQANVMQYMHLPQVHVIKTVVFASPLPLLLFGMGCLFAVEWCRRASIAFLVLECLALLWIIHLLVHGLIVPGMDSTNFYLTPREGYFAAALALFVNGFLCEFLLRAQAVQRR